MAPKGSSVYINKIIFHLFNVFCHNVPCFFHNHRFINSLSSSQFITCPQNSIYVKILWIFLIVQKFAPPLLRMYYNRETPLIRSVWCRCILSYSPYFSTEIEIVLGSFIVVFKIDSYLYPCASTLLCNSNLPFKKYCNLKVNTWIKDFTLYPKSWITPQFLAHLVMSLCNHALSVGSVIGICVQPSQWQL